MITRRLFCVLLGGSLEAIRRAGFVGFNWSASGGTAARIVSATSPDPIAPGAIRPTGFRWRRAPIYGGGFVIGLDIANDGSRMVHWADVFNGYIRDHGEGEWKLLLRRDNLATSEYDPRQRTPTTDQGIFAARMAPSDKNTLYVSWNGLIYKSTDGGAKFNRTAFKPRRMQSNLGPQRRFNRAMDVHPEDPARIIVGTNNDGVHYSLDGGDRWGEIAVPAASDVARGAGKYLVAFAPQNVVYVHVPGSGLFRSTNGAAGPFSNVGGPLVASCLVVSRSGAVYVCEYIFNALLKRFDGTTWTALPCPADQIAIDPFDEKHLFAVGENLVGRTPVIRRSIDGGATWTSHVFTRGSGEVAWLSDRHKPSFPAHILFDPVVRGKIWMADGVGVTWSTVPEPGEVWTLHDYSAGNAELVPVTTVSVPGSPAILCFWDKPFWRLDDDTGPSNMWTYPIAAGGSFEQGTVTVGYGLDYAPEDPQFLVGLTGQGTNRNGYSTDGGRSWTEFPVKPAAPFRFGGAVAVSTKRNFVILSSNNGSGAATLDGGLTWQPVRFGGYDPVLEWTNAYYVNRLNIAADKTRPGVFAALVNNLRKLPDGRDAIGRDIGGLWLSTDGGITWARQFVGTLQGTAGAQGQFWQCRLRYVPGHARELMYADGDGNPGNRLIWSRDDGATWRDAHSAIRSVTSFGFGRAAKGIDRPAVFFAGKVNGKKGVYASFDWFASEPVLLSAAPLDTIGQIVDVTGDFNVFGRCYAMISGNGAAICDYRA